MQFCRESFGFRRGIFLIVVIFDIADSTSLTRILQDNIQWSNPSYVGFHPSSGSDGRNWDVESGSSSWSNTGDATLSATLRILGRSSSSSWNDGGPLQNWSPIGNHFEGRRRRLPNSSEISWNNPPPLHSGSWSDETSSIFGVGRTTNDRPPFFDGRRPDEPSWHDHDDGFSDLWYRARKV
uniref:Uncharacterized protein n=1 Tax=Romanomermis culicivorax TaxID=13658 RepID=A0A915HIR9_ROMCU